MAEVYEDTAGYQQIIRRAKFMATLLERKKLYIDDNLFVGSMASTVNGIYTYPEWNVDWMKEEKTVEKSQDPGGQEGERVGARLLGEACAEAPDAARSSRRGTASIRNLAMTPASSSSSSTGRVAAAT